MRDLTEVDVTKTATANLTTDAVFITYAEILDTIVGQYLVLKHDVGCANPGPEYILYSEYASPAFTS